MEKLEKLLQAILVKMNMLETELESTQTLLVNIFSSSEKGRQKI